MKKLLLATILLFTGCSYKNHTFKNDFEKQKEVNRDNCQKTIAKLEDNKLIIKQKCLVTYDGIRSETYNTCEFSTGTYIGGSILFPIAGAIYLPFALIGTLVGMDGGSDMLKKSLILTTYPISAPFYRPDNCEKNNITAYEINKNKKFYKGKETLKFKDTVNIHPDKEIWIGNKNHQYPLKLNDDLTYYMPNRLIKYFCKDKENCNLTIFTKDDDELKKLTTINIK